MQSGVKTQGGLVSLIAEVEVKLRRLQQLSYNLWALREIPGTTD